MQFKPGGHVALTPVCHCVQFQPGGPVALTSCWETHLAPCDFTHTLSSSHSPHTLSLCHRLSPSSWHPSLPAPFSIRSSRCVVTIFTTLFHGSYHWFGCYFDHARVTPMVRQIQRCKFKGPSSLDVWVCFQFFPSVALATHNQTAAHYWPWVACPCMFINLTGEIWQPPLTSAGMQRNSLLCASPFSCLDKTHTTQVAAIA